MSQYLFEKMMKDAYNNTGLLFGKYKFKTIPDEPHVSRWIKQDGYWEGYVSSVVYRYFKRFKPKVCVDIGANIGYYSFLYHYLGAEAIYAFEPVPQNYKVLLENVIENNLEDSIYAYQMAVIDSAREITIYTDAGLPNSHIFGGKEAIRVPAVSLDEFFYNETFDQIIKLDKPEFLKIDAEGSEYKIIMGAKRLLESDSLKAIHIEMATDRGYNVDELFEFVSGYFPFSYDMLSGSPGGVAVQVRSFMDIMFSKYAFDFYAQS